jgi:uncharacterized protein involved in exopolysaccharide biosynthesis
MLALFALIGAVVAAVVSLLLPAEFETTAAFQAESSSTSSLPSALAGLASQFSNLPLASNSSVNAQFFGDLITTDVVLRRLLNDSFPSAKGGRATLARIYGVAAKPPGLRDADVIRHLRNGLSVAVNSRTNVVRFTGPANSPKRAKTLADAILGALNDVNILLRQTRGKTEQTFTAARAVDARVALSAAEAALTRFYERNRSLTNSPSLLTEEGRLRRAVDLSQTIYTQLRLQQEQAAVQAVRNTPAITTIDPPIEPVRRSKPKRRFITLLGFLVGLSIGALWLITSRPPESP